MKNRYSMAALSALFVYCASSAGAGLEIDTGLWEMKMDISSESGQYEAAMAQAKQMLESMPPDQQKMMKDMMAARGVNLDMGNVELKVCMTQERIDNFELPNSDDNCSQKFTEQGKNRYKLTMECEAQNMTGEGEFVVKDDKNFEGTVLLNANINGTADKMTMKQVGTWISADCGDIEP